MPAMRSLTPNTDLVDSGQTDTALASRAKHTSNVSIVPSTLTLSMALGKLTETSRQTFGSQIHFNYPMTSLGLKSFIVYKY